MTSDDAQGSGLGLAIASELAERMNGRLAVDSQPGRTTFTLATLQDRAHCDERRAADLIHLAQELKWIWTPAEGIWVGQLSGRR